MKNGFLLGLSQYLLTQLYIGIYLAISPSTHWFEIHFLPVNFIIILSIIIISTYTVAVKLNIECRDLRFQMLTLFVCFLVYQLGWFYLFVFSFRRGFIWEDFDITSIIYAFFTAVEYYLISLFALKLFE